MLSFGFLLLGFLAIAPIFSEGEETSNNQSFVDILIPKTSDNTTFRNKLAGNNDLLNFKPVFTTSKDDFDSLGIWRDWYK
jgi:hypothetical protein